MKLLITGGAGYVGSHTVMYAQTLGHQVTVLDNFSTGHRTHIKNCEVIDLDLLDKSNLFKFLRGKSFDGVIHFAAKSLVEESFIFPLDYYQNNVIGSLNLIEAMKENSISNLVFSSSAAIFGKTNIEIINEDHPKNPINPYGKSKLIVEQMLRDISSEGNLSITSLRYFNAAGADPSGLIGELHEPETHLIPKILQSLQNVSLPFSIYGSDYDTPDGTCIRDYIHVNDLASVHLLALDRHYNIPGFFDYNIGSGRGYSVLEVMNTCSKITGKRVRYEFRKKREGDPQTLIADNSKVTKELGWSPINSDLSNIVKTAWNWHRNLS